MSRNHEEVQVRMRSFLTPPARLFHALLCSCGICCRRRYVRVFLPLVIAASIYRVRHLLADLGCVDLDLESSIILPGQ